MKKLIIAFLLAATHTAFAQQPIFTTVTGGDLYSLDLANCSRQFIGATGIGFGDIALSTDGQLWGIAGGELFHINTTTANATSIGFTGLDAVSLVGLNDTTLLAEAGQKLYRVSTNTAFAQYIDTIGYAAAGDLTWYDDDLYMVTSGGQVVKIVLNSTITAITSVIALGSSIPTCEGAVTAQFANDYNSIIGFNGKNAIKICQIDGSYQMLCPDLNIDGVPGAASMRLVTQSPKPVTCAKPTAVETVHIDDLFSIFPNPAKNELNIAMSNESKFEFNIYNTLGQLVHSGLTTGKKTVVDLTRLANGLYSIELRINNQLKRERFVVAR
ncbi:T9SS type A sorting domain-containing protein [Taibaiella soli]|uniref:Secretion system C-terminal sorting domain-containing protein n=1 Tax=Taibaiella soli TaxID=1649169 RepID=A0A2W2BJG2_9BACT|nr:T9SS type A sorting domain-containing protein [Taibaiella soli]PZF73576.1 hypothetical protein DN068_07590 [Taibaiella soli]